MLRFLKSVKNYYQLYTCIIDFYQYCKEIKTVSAEELDIFADSIIPLIKQCGCVCIKFAQWLTPVLDLIYNEVLPTAPSYDINSTIAEPLPSAPNHEVMISAINPAPIAEVVNVNFEADPKSIIMAEPIPE